jgi:hypothetical protein
MIDNLHSFHNKVSTNKQAGDSNDPSFVPQQRDKSIKVPRFYEFQFYSDFEALQTIATEIQKILDSFQMVPEDLKLKF